MFGMINQIFTFTGINGLWLTQPNFHMHGHFPWGKIKEITACRKSQIRQGRQDFLFDVICMTVPSDS